MSMTLTGRSSTITQRWCARQSIVRQAPGRLQSSPSCVRRGAVLGVADIAKPRYQALHLPGERLPGNVGPVASSIPTDSPRALAPAQLPDDLRPYLSGVESDRQVSDWGRSERIEGALDQTVVEFLYRYWFRVQVEGIENVPSRGGALLVSNHSGALPPDAPMIAAALQREHPRPRKLHLTMEHFFKGYPGFAMLLPKLGGVPAHPANVHRLLFDEGQLVLVFPEGRKGTEKLYKDRYRLRRFGRGGFVEAAMRARAPLVPIAVVGAEEAAPIFAHVPLLQRLTGLTYFPLTPTFPWFGVLGMLGYLPARLHLRFLEPVATDRWGERPWEDRGLVQTVAQEIRELIQENVLEMVAGRESVWLG